MCSRGGFLWRACYCGDVGIYRVTGWAGIALGILGLVASMLMVVNVFSDTDALLTPLQLFMAAAFAGMSLAFILIGRRLVRPPTSDLAPVVPRGVTPVPVVPESEASALRVPIEACPDCGFLGIRMPTIHDGLWPGGGETGARMVCPRCDWQGLPVSFREAASYAEFTRDLNERRSAA